MDFRKSGQGHGRLPNSLGFCHGKFELVMEKSLKFYLPISV